MSCTGIPTSPRPESGKWLSRATGGSRLPVVHLSDFRATDWARSSRSCQKWHADCEVICLGEGDLHNPTDWADRAEEMEHGHPANRLSERCLDRTVGLGGGVRSHHSPM